MTEREVIRAQLETVLSPAVVELLDRLVAERVREELAAADRPADAKTWLTVQEAATRLGIKDDALRMRVHRGRLEGRRHGRRLYVSAASVDSLGRE